MKKKYYRPNFTVENVPSEGSVGVTSERHMQRTFEKSFPFGKVISLRKHFIKLLSKITGPKS
ncbi:hypothetical protein PQ465_12425 [Sphingobacterium oryzagri]|uniref:Uncharacterized protein n=1 Tax=Sphingobacterium oryzagri TaxID=3025669 RepID=A0ABY7WCB1_9SPHI|nr:hypothetical protein [Sphingobacterium sp. KACC 22765]WDF67112.1 hypothetical protein PQ465_12425 [Sphingobacterium sp. KACC 22765]